MWVPGFEQPYNRFLSTRIPNGLDRERLGMAAEGARHPGLNGLANDTNADIYTPFLSFRPFLGQYAIPNPPVNNTVFNLSD